MRRYYTSTTPPQPLPFRVTLPSGESRTNLGALSDTELEAFGFFLASEQPVVGPSFNVDWVNNAWLVTEVNKNEKRANAKMSKMDFCLALIAAGILTKDEGVAAGKGGWPATFATYLQNKTELEQAQLELRWMYTTEVHYSDPLLQGLALLQASGDTTIATQILDTIFSIS